MGVSDQASVGLEAAHVISTFTEMIRALIMSTRADGLFFKLEVKSNS